MSNGNTGPSSGSRTPEPNREGQRVGNYRLLRRLGQGGTGCVYEAIDETTQGHYAIKVLSVRFAQNEDAHRRFQEEARAAVAVDNEGLVPVFGTAELADGTPCIMMKLLTGELLRQRLSQWTRHQASITWALRTACQLAQALAAAHAGGIIHCDIKPENVMMVPTSTVDGGERPILLDFGIAKFREAPTLLNQGPDQLIGTPTYMSPEQCRGSAQLNERTDVYSLGCVLYEMLCGVPPYCSDPRDRSHVTRQHIYGRPRPAVEHRSDLPPSLVSLLSAMLRRDAAQRPGMEEIAKRCQQILEQNSAGTARAWKLVMPVGILLLILVAFLIAALRRPNTAMLRPAMIPTGMVLLPATTFGMGSSDAEALEALQQARGPLACPDCRPEYYRREQPLHPVTLPSFYLDSLETTNAQFVGWLRINRAVVEQMGQDVADKQPGADAGAPDPERRRRITVVQNGSVRVAVLETDQPGLQGIRGLYADAQGIQVVPGMEDKPVVYVTWDGANQYCQAQGKRLPTEEEWERAARGAERRRFVWGSALPVPSDCALGWPLHSPVGLRAVGKSPRDRTPEGIYDLAGNASEWTADRFRPSYSICKECELPASVPANQAKLRVVRGGSWHKEPDSARGASRSQRELDLPTGDIGFRCARDAQIPAPQ